MNYLFSEYVSKENSVFEFIKELKESGLLDLKVPKVFYNSLLNNLEIKKYIKNLSLFKASLGLNEFAAAIQAQYHFYKEYIIEEFTGFDHSCPIWVDWGGRQVCTPAQLTNLDFHGWKQ